MLEALSSELMQPDLVAELGAELTKDWNLLVAEASAGAAAKRRELEAVQRKLAGLIEAIADGLRAPGLQGRLDELEARRRVLEGEIAAAGSPMASRLHPNLSEVYRDKVARLRDALDAQDSGPEQLEAARDGWRCIPLPRPAPRRGSRCMGIWYRCCDWRARSGRLPSSRDSVTSSCLAGLIGCPSACAAAVRC